MGEWCQPTHNPGMVRVCCNIQPSEFGICDLFVNKVALSSMNGFRMYCTGGICFWVNVLSLVSKLSLEVSAHRLVHCSVRWQDIKFPPLQASSNHNKISLPKNFERSIALFLGSSVGCDSNEKSVTNAAWDHGSQTVSPSN